MSGASGRLDAALLRREQLESLDGLLRDHPRLLGKDGSEVELPEPILRALLRIVGLMKQGRSVTLTAEKETVSTQAAANYLGVSRPFLIKLLSEAAIPFHMTGTHRRIRLNDLKAFASERDGGRRADLDRLFGRIDEAGLYFEG